MVSPTAKKIVGVFIPDDTRPRPSTIKWVQEECRKGSLRKVVDEFTRAQDEPLDADLLLVEKIDDSGMTCRIPCKVTDHESPHAFYTEVWFRLDPVAKECARLNDQRAT
jgi:hypothetical protein